MNRLTTLIGLAGTAAMLGLGSAHAADPMLPVEMVAVEGYNWSGFYVGGNVGYGWGEADHQAGPTSGSGINDLDIDGPFAGGQIGYNFQYNQIVFGAEADIQWSGIDGDCAAGVCGGGGPPATSHEIDWFGTLRGRIGYAMGNWMPYITGGYAFGEATRETASGGGDSFTNNIDGWVIGGGVEWGFASNWSAKAEYQYLDFGDEEYAFSVGGFDPIVDLHIHTVRVGLNYRFN